jgi:hypothetical protein
VDEVEDSTPLTPPVLWLEYVMYKAMPSASKLTEKRSHSSGLGFGMEPAGVLYVMLMWPSLPSFADDTDHTYGAVPV